MHTIRLIIAVSLSLIIAGSPVLRADDRALAAKRDTIDRLRQQAVANCKAGDYDGAIRDYNGLLALDPDDAPVMKDLMWAYWKRKYFEQAGETARKVITARPRDKETVLLLARLPTAENRAAIGAAYRKAGYRMSDEGYSDAVVLFDQVSALVPKSPKPAPYLLSGFWLTGNYREGAQLAAYLTALKPDDADYWNWRGKMESSLGHEDEAISAYRRSLEIDPQQPVVHLLIGRELVSKREFDRAIAELEPLRTEKAALKELSPLLGKALFWTRRYEESIPLWEDAVRSFPEKPGYQFYEAQALYFSGFIPEALAKFKVLYEKGNTSALDFMADAAYMRRDLAGAEELLEKALRTMTPADEGRTMRLAFLYSQNGQYEKESALLERFLEIWPDNLLALQMKAALLTSMGRYAEALRVYEQIGRYNPGNVGTLTGATNCHLSLGNYPAALALNAKLRTQDPSNPNYLRQEAELLRLAGQRERAKRALIEWLDKNRANPVVPVLLYHGLTPRPADPMLSYTYHHSVAMFEDHIRSLREAGYEPVVVSQVAAWRDRGTPLPKKPVMVTFDDGRSDSFLYGDPVLKKYGFRATMFAAMVNIEGHRPPGYVSWDTLRAYRDTGRWEIQSHGNFAHVVVPSGPGGKRGLFLINRQWLEREDRYESDGEWRDRVAGDYESSKRKIAEQLGGVPCGYAFPQGYYGQEGNCNSPGAASLNTELAPRSFPLLFVQDPNGINLCSRTTGFMKRFIPENHLGGKDLLKHLEMHDPFTMAYLQLIDFALDDGNNREALYWLEQAGKNGASRELLTALRSEIYFNLGDVDRSRKLARQALETEDSPRLRKIAGYRENTELGTEFGTVNDNSNRRDWTVNNTLRVGRSGPVQWNLRQAYGEYRQDTPSPVGVTDRAAGMSAVAALDPFHRVSGEVLGHALTGAARNEYTFSGAVQSVWTDRLSTRLEAGRSLYDTARALQDNITSAYGDLAVRWSGEGIWKAGLRETHRGLSDGNSRDTASLELSRAIALSGALRGVYRFTYDDMPMNSSSYYSPRLLHMNELGLAYSYSAGRAGRLARLDCGLSYMPAYTQEQGSPDAITHNVEAYVLMKFGAGVVFKPAYVYYETPSYRENRLTTELSVGF